MNPIMSISGSEPHKIKEALGSISVVDTAQVYPDYKIYSKLGFTVGVARATSSDLVSNKTDVASHVAEELDNIKCDLRIFLHEDFMGRNHNKKVVLPGGRERGWNYMYIVNMVLAACLATDAMWVPSANILSTIDLLENWNNEFFQHESHHSLSLRPRRVRVTRNTEDDPFALDISTDDRVWWLSDVPGVNIGLKRAKAMLGGGTLMDLFLKTPTELARIKEVGPRIARGFWSFIYER